MAIQRDGGDVVFECDSCSEWALTETDEFDQALDNIKRNGWKVSKIGDEWIHTCPDCQSKKRVADARI